MPSLDADFQRREIERLILVFERARRELLAVLRSVNATDFQVARSTELVGQIDDIVAQLRQSAHSWIMGTLPDSYAAGAVLAARAFNRPLPTMSGIHATSVAALAAEVEASLDGEALASIAPFAGSVFIRAKQTVIAYERLMQELGVAEVRGLTIRDITQRLAAAFREGAAARLRLGDVVDPQLRADLEATAEGRLIRIVGKDGKARNYDLGWYAETVGRTATREAASEGVLVMTQQFGGDLVQISVHEGSCPICLPWQGKVFSISGTHADFPPLTDDVTPPLHPRCEHILLPIVEDFMRSRGVYDRLRDFSAGDQPVNNVQEYHDLLTAPAA